MTPPADLPPSDPPADTAPPGPPAAGRTAAVDPVALRAWADTTGALPGSGPLLVEPLGEGHSNLTYAVSRAEGGEAFVLRRPPLGPLLPTAHDVVREHLVLTLLGRDGTVRVPEATAVCEDPAVIGAPFYLMRRAEGVVVRDRMPAFMAGDDGFEARRAVGTQLPVVLGEIAEVAWEPFVEAGIGRPGGYLERQLRRWVGQREGIQAAVAAAGGTARELPDYDAVRDWLRAHLPAEVEPAVVHGDYKLDNVLVAPALDGVVPSARITAVVDWEMATVGDPRADLGYLLSFWPEPGEELPLMDLVPVLDGAPGRDEVVALWEETTGRDAGDTRWFIALAVWKLAILLEASYHRWLAGLSDDPFFARLDVGVPALLARAREVCGA